MKFEAKDIILKTYLENISTKHFNLARKAYNWESHGHLRNLRTEIFEGIFWFTFQVSPGQDSGVTLQPEVETHTSMEKIYLYYCCKWNGTGLYL